MKQPFVEFDVSQHVILEVEVLQNCLPGSTPKTGIPQGLQDLPREALDIPGFEQVSVDAIRYEFTASHAARGQEQSVAVIEVLNLREITPKLARQKADPYL